MTATTADELWLRSQLCFVREHLPPAPSRILEVGCGPLGGFVPALAQDGHDVTGVDPAAPARPRYHQLEIEAYDASQRFDAVVACTSLHHVADVEVVLDRIALLLVPGGLLVVVEWASERFDEATAEWCFERLGDDGTGWLDRHRAAWQESGLTWPAYLQTWCEEERLHPGTELVAALRERFEPWLLARGPYFYPDLENTSEAAEQAAIDAGRIRPTCIRYVGQRR